MPSRIVRWILAGDSSSAVRAFKETEVAAATAGTEVEAAGAKSVSTMEATAVGARKLHSGIKSMLGLAGLGGVAFGLRDAVRAGQEWQVQQAQLRNSLRNTGLTSAETLKALNEAVDKSATHGGFTPAQETQGLTQFISLTHSASKAIQLNTEAINFARRTGQSYETSVRAVSQIQTGAIGRWQKYLGIIQPVTYYMDKLTSAQRSQNPQLVKQAQLLDKQATAAKANQIILKGFAGATQAYSNTSQGAIQNAQNAFDILAEKWGTVLLPVVTKVAQALTKVAEFVAKNGRLVLALVAGIAALVTVIKVWTTVQAILDSELWASGAPELAIAVAALTVGIIYLAGHTRQFAALWGSVWHGIRSIAGATIGWVIGRIHDLTHAFSSITHAPGKFLSGVVHSLGFAQGGLVPGYAGGGFVGSAGPSDVVPAMLTPGEFIVRREVVNAVGPRNLAALNQTANLPSGVGGQDVVLHHQTILGVRVIAEEVTRYNLKRGSRK